jgi:hypothetical protein
MTVVADLDGIESVASPRLARDTIVRFTLNVCDNGSPVMCASTSVMVAINDVNESPVLASATIGVSENTAGNATVGTPVVSSDPDAGDSLTVAITNETSITNIFSLVWCG